MTLETMEAELASLLDPMDIPGDWTPRKRESYESRRSWLRAKIQDASAAQAVLARAVPQIAALEEWLAHLNVWRPQLCEDLMALGRGDKRQFPLKLSIQCIDRGVRVLEDTGYVLATIPLGALMRRNGFVESRPIENMLVGTMPFYGSLPDVKHRIAELTAARHDAQVRLDAALRDPEPAAV